MADVNPYLKIEMEKTGKESKFNSEIYANLEEALIMWLSLGRDVARSFGIPQEGIIDAAKLMARLKFDKDIDVDSTALLKLGGDSS